MKVDKTLCFGLTGGIGSGKTTAAELFMNLGIQVLNADHIARQLVSVNRPAYTTILQRYGQECYLPSGELNRAWLREKVFAHPQERSWLEALLHPLIRTEIEQWLKEQRHQPYVILEAPLLFETGLDLLTEGVMVVDVPEPVQIERASHRDGLAVEQVKKIMDTQISRTERLERGSYILDNRGDLASLAEQVQLLHAQLMALTK